MDDQRKVTFVICTYNRAGYLDDTLNSIFQQDLSGLNFEVLVVDNNSTDRTPEIVQRYQELAGKDDKPIRYIKETKQGLSHARNRAIKETSTECLVFLDDDIRASESLIPAWISFFNNRPEALAGGGKIHVQFDDPRPDWMSHFLLPLLGHHDLGDSPKKYPNNKYPFGGNMGFRKKVFEQLGYFKTNLGRIGKQLKASEEKEFFRRMKSKNIECRYIPDAMLFHRVDKQRLTQEYIKRQSLGLGQSIALQVQKNAEQKMKYLLSELLKWGASFLLFLPYLVSLQPAKALMLIKFRKWIAEGYFAASD